jgi:antitoxin VapB
MDTAPLIDDSAGQTIRLPEGYRFPGSKVYLKRVGSTVVLIPENAEWQSMFDSLDMFTPDFMSERDQPKNANTTR